jgi:hypothetical protein
VSLVIALALALLAGPFLGDAHARVLDTPSPASRQEAFRNAAREFGVPERVLLAVSYSVSRWEHHGGAHSTSAGYGPMHLTDLDAALEAGEGHGTGHDHGIEYHGHGDRSAALAEDDPDLSTLARAAALVGEPAEGLRADDAQNIRGGAALLAQYARETTGRVPAGEAEWYGAVARYSGSEESAVAHEFAEQVYALLARGESRVTRDGEAMSLAAGAVAPDKATARGLRLRDSRRAGADCPANLSCTYIPAAYAQNSPDDPTDYGNYDLADRERDGLDIDYVVIHDTEIPFDTTVAVFQNPLRYASSHYLLRSLDGYTAQMVDNKDIAYTAGNWYVNMHSINIEHEGVAIEGAAWYSEQMYRSSARLVRHLARKYGIPLDRGHIIGHDDVPGPIAALQRTMHWDPGPYWDWEHYMRLLGAPITPKGPKWSSLVTIRPGFEENQPAVSYCYTDGCRDVPQQPASFIPLYTAPAFDAPLADDPSLPGPGTTRAYDWGSKAAAGQQFYRVERRGDWDAIYYGGQRVWYHNPGGDSVTVPGRGLLVRPRAGLASVHVYGRAYPETSAYPEGIPAQAVTPLGYTIPAGQLYVVVHKVGADYYRAVEYGYEPSPTEDRVVEGSDEYYVIFFNHRLAFVKASDVEVVAGR